jgi:hypothetical protein
MTPLSPPEPATAPERIRRPSRRDLGRVTGWYLLSRVLVVLLAQTAIWANAPSGNVLRVLTRWDSGFYGAIANSGYPRTGANSTVGGKWAFFPAWPLLIRVTRILTFSEWRRSAVVLAFVLGLIGVLFVWALVVDAFDSVVADRAVLLLLFAPSAFVFSMAYTEALFLALSAACLYALRRKWWLMAGLTAAVAGASRVPGIVLFACCLAAVVWEVHEHGPNRRAWIAPVLAPTGLLAFLAYQWWRIGDPFEFVSAQRMWRNQIQWGAAVPRTFWKLIAGPDRLHNPFTFIVAVVLVYYAACLVIMFLVRRRVPLTWWIYTIGIVAVAVSPRVIGPRYLLPAFPPLACLAARLPERWFPAVLAASTVMMSIIAVLSFGAGGIRMAP